MTDHASRAIRIAEPLLRPALSVVRRLETLLGPADDWVEDDRRVLFEAADQLLRPIGRPTIREVPDSDRVGTVPSEPNSVEVTLQEEGYQRNLLSTRKYREHHDGGRQWAVGSWVHDPRDEPWQHHVYLFDAPDGATDVYAHKEASVREPSDHHGGDGLERGVPMGIIEVLDAAQ